MSISAFVQSEKLARFHVYNGSSGFKDWGGKQENEYINKTMFSLCVKPSLAFEVQLRNKIK